MPSFSYYVNLRQSLKEMMVEDSENSIQNVVQSLAWNDSIYRTFNEGLRLATHKQREGRIPGSLVEYIHNVHVSYVVTSLRKLYEDKKEGSRAVYSIRTITQKITNNSHLITRHNYLTHDSTPYNDHQSLDWRTNYLILYRHDRFDKLCRLKPGASRKPDERIDNSVTKYLHKYAVLRPEIEQFANKFLLHASAKGNRPDENLAFRNITLKRIQTQCRNVIWAVQQIANIIDEPILTEVPGTSFDVLANWEHWLFDDKIKSKLNDYWGKRMGWWRHWTNHYMDSNVLFMTPYKHI